MQRNIVPDSQSQTAPDTPRLHRRCRQVTIHRQGARLHRRCRQVTIHRQGARQRATSQRQILFTPIHTSLRNLIQLCLIHSMVRFRARSKQRKLALQSFLSINSENVIVDKRFDFLKVGLNWSRVHRLPASNIVRHIYIRHQRTLRIIDFQIRAVSPHRFPRSPRNST